MSTKKRMFKWELSGSMLLCRSADTEITLARFEADAEWTSGIRDQLLCYGLKQKLSDSVSDDEGAEAKLAGMSDMYARLVDGEWMREREGGARTVSVLVEAVARVKGAAIPSVQKALSEYTKEQKAKLALNEKVAAAMQAIEAERAAATGTDLDDLLDE